MHNYCCNIVYIQCYIPTNVGCFLVTMCKTYCFFYFAHTDAIALTTLNYTSYYTLHPKLFECTFCTLNYDTCYTLHPDVKFAVNLDGKIWHHMKKPNCPSSPCGLSFALAFGIDLDSSLFCLIVFLSPKVRVRLLLLFLYATEVPLSYRCRFVLAFERLLL